MPYFKNNYNVGSLVEGARVQGFGVLGFERLGPRALGFSSVGSRLSPRKHILSMGRTLQALSNSQLKQGFRV